MRRLSATALGRRREPRRSSRGLPRKRSRRGALPAFEEPARKRLRRQSRRSKRNTGPSAVGLRGAPAWADRSLASPEELVLDPVRVVPGVGLQEAGLLG